MAKDDTESGGEVRGGASGPPEEEGEDRAEVRWIRRPSGFNPPGTFGSIVLAPGPGAVGFTVPGHPVEWQRAVRTSRGNVFNTPAHKKQKAKIATAARLAVEDREAFYEKQLAVWIVFRLAPRRTATRVRESLARRAWLRSVYHRDTPDLDNLEKMVLDGLKGAVYKDDRQVVSKCACKVLDLNEGIDIIISTVTDERSK